MTTPNEAFEEWCKTAHEIPGWFTMGTAKKWELIFLAGRTSALEEAAEVADTHSDDYAYGSSIPTVVGDIMTDILKLKEKP